MDTTIKHQLHSLIDDCNDEFILTEAKTLLENSVSNKDWMDDLSEKDKNLLMESETQYEKGNFISHEQLMQQFDEWKKK